MKRVAASVLVAGAVLLGSAPAVSQEAAPLPPPDPVLPATDINRERNNPAKEAIRAKEAQDKDRARDQAAAEADPPPPIGPVADNAQLVRLVEAGLRNDSRTAALGVTVRVDEQGLIGLHGNVPSDSGRVAAMEVAKKVTGAARLRNHLVVVEKK